MSKLETCRHGHSRVGLYNTTPGGQRYCRDCASVKMGAWRAKTGRVSETNSKYAEVYDTKVRATIANLEKRVAQIQKQIAKHKARIEK
jgi:uncharacterized protein YceH (UPF0502 family)